MKVLRQEWHSPEHGQLTSLSLNQTQINATFERIKKKEPEIELDGDAMEITIPDNSPFVAMVQDDTVFLRADEMEVVYEANDNEKQ